MGSALGRNYFLDKNYFNGKVEEIVIYHHTIYPVDPLKGEVVISKPMKELTDNSSIAAGRPILGRLFIKDYHNIRGSTPEEVAQSSQLSVLKAGIGLKTR